LKKFETIYVIDDDDTYQFIAKRIIEESCSTREIKGFLNGFDAFQSLKSAIDQPHLIPEIILLDLTMPVMDGWQFLDQYILLAPKLGKKIILYVVSSSVDPIDVEKARSIEQVSDYIVKPITKEKFTDLINTYS
jgi:CheY-like chemotaxis protein